MGDVDTIQNDLKSAEVWLGHMTTHPGYINKPEDALWQAMYHIDKASAKAAALYKKLGQQS